MNQDSKLYSTIKGDGDTPVVFLHGLWGGGNYFRGFKFFDPEKHIQYFPDELGFGRSPKPAIEYTLENHCQAIYESLPNKYPFIVIGNSFGASLAIQFAKQYPKAVKKLVLISPVIHANSREARQYLSHRLIPRLTIEWPLLAHLICRCFCSTRLLEIISPFYFRSHRVKFMKGCTYHTWKSYYSSFTYGFLKDTVTPNDLSKLAVIIPTLIIYGTSDSYVDTALFKTIHGKKLDTVSIDGTHNVMFEKFNEVKSCITKWVER